MNSFIDTNVSIAYTFLIDPLNHNSSNLFKKYVLIFWSYFVKWEFDKVFISKKGVLVKFYKKLWGDLKKNNFIGFTLSDLKRYVKEGNYIKKDYKQIESSLSSFWEKYVDESFPSLSSLETAIILCLMDLMIVSYTRKNDLENRVLFADERIEEYPSLKNQLSLNGLHPSDIKVILDAHDHNLKTSYDLDFITFDKDCYDCAKANDFSFHDVKYKWDFVF